MKNYFDSTSDEELIHIFQSKFSMYDQSNIFLRDVQFSLWEYLEENGVGRQSHGTSEEVALSVLARLERQQVVKRLNHQTWLLHCPAMKTPAAQPAAKVAAVPA
jgi:hypothetical protein